MHIVPSGCGSLVLSVALDAAFREDLYSVLVLSR